MSVTGAPAAARARLLGMPRVLEGVDPDAVGRTLGGHEPEIRTIISLSEVGSEAVPTALFLCHDHLEAGGESPTLARLPAHVTVVATDSASVGAAESAGRLFLGLDPAASGAERTRAAGAALSHSELLLRLRRTRMELDQARSALRELNVIGVALMSERDPQRLLDLILTQARRLTASDAGSLYLVEDGPGEEERGDEDSEVGRSLHFLRAQNDSIPDLPEPDFTLPLDRSSVAGYAALTGRPLVLEDAYHISPDQPYSFNRSFDEDFGYRAKSMLVVPMVDHRGRCVGVLQLINRKRRPDASIRTEEDAREHVLSYDDRQVELVQSLAGQAAVSIENGRLYEAIENLFEGFIKAAVTAIDQRDPATSGHSVRVTELTCGLAEVVDAESEGRFADVFFSRAEMKQLRYSGLLHDFGKVGVREHVLTKQKKLSPEAWTGLESRFRRIRQAARGRFEADRARRLEEHGKDGYDSWLAQRERELDEEMRRINEYWAVVSEANEPRPLPEDGPEILDEIRAASYTDLAGNEIPFLTDDELGYLRIRKGSLNEEERLQIQSHVLHGFDFLQEIPWTEELARVDEIMLGHHEKLDGGGYPRGVEADSIPLETRMMTVADIFDALTASDRPYKKAMPVERALSILRAEAEEGALDPDLVDLFIESKVYERVLGVDWRDL